jgi:lipid-binding SYLF domain-containing protein
MEEFKKQGLVDEYFEKSYGWAAFPKVGKFAFLVGVGGAGGEVFVKKDGGEAEKVGKATLALASGGWSLGLTVFSEIIFFENKEAYDLFTNGNFEFQAGAKVHVLNAAVDSAARTTGSSETAAVAGEGGSAKNFGYHGGMATFVLPKMGAMIDVSAEGQKFFFEPTA